MTTCLLTHSGVSSRGSKTRRSTPDCGPRVLQSLAEAVGAIGAAYIVRNARTGRVDWANFLGPSAELK